MKRRELILFVVFLFSTVFYAFPAGAAENIGQKAPVWMLVKNNIKLNNDGTLWKVDENTENTLRVGDIDDVIDFDSTELLPAPYVHNIIALKSDRTVWIGDSEGNFSRVDSLKDVSDVLVSGKFEVGLKAGGMQIPVKNIRYTVLLSDGTVWNWGDNNYGELGTGKTGERAEKPVKVPGISNIYSISGDYYRTVAVEKDGTTWAWGINARVESEMPDLKQIPVKVNGVDDAVSVSADTGWTAVIRKDGSVWQLYKPFAESQSGQYAKPLVAQKVEGLKNIKTINVETNTSTAVDSRGILWKWDFNGKVNKVSGLYSVLKTAGPFILKKDGSILGNDGEIKYKGVSGIKSFDFNPSARLGAGTWYYITALGKDGTVMVMNDFVNGLKEDESLKFTKADGLDDILDVKATYDKTVALKKDGSVWIYSRNEKMENTSERVGNLDGIKAISAGYSKILALKDDGTVWFGTGISDFAMVRGLSDVVSIAVGGKTNPYPYMQEEKKFSHFAAVKKDGTLWVWGDNQAYVRNSTVTSIVPVKVRKDLLVFEIDSPYMLCNGIETEVDPGKDTSPVIKDGRTLVPIRAAIEKLGGRVSWSESEKMITIEMDSRVIKFIIDYNKALVNDIEVDLDVEPEIINGRTMIPLRFISENLGYSVEWSGAENRIYIN